MIYPIPRKKMLIPKKSPFTKIPGIKKSPDFKNPHSRNKKFWGLLNEDCLGSQIPNPYPRNENSTVPRVQTYTNKDLLSRGILVTGLSNRFLSRSRLCRGFKSRCKSLRDQDRDPDIVPGQPPIPEKFNWVKKFSI